MHGFQRGLQQCHHRAFPRILVLASRSVSKAAVAAANLSPLSMIRAKMRSGFRYKGNGAQPSSWTLPPRDDVSRLPSDACLTPLLEVRSGVCALSATVGIICRRSVPSHSNALSGLSAALARHVTVPCRLAPFLR